MARGDMYVENTTFGTGTEILNRPPFTATPMTIDFADVSDVDNTGVKIVKAGTPIDKEGKPLLNTPWTGALGILLHDVRELRPQGALLRDAYINVKRAQDHSGLTYDSALVTAMANCNNSIKFEEPIIIAS